MTNYRMTSLKFVFEPKLKFLYTVHIEFMVMVSFSQPKQREVKRCILF